MTSSKFSMLAVVLAAGVGLPMSAAATEFDFNFGDQDFNAVLNQTLTAGVAFRIEERDSRLLGKSSINPEVCSGVYQLCQGLNRTQSYPAEKLRRSPGAASLNFDDGDLNFDRGDVTQSPVVWTHDLKIALLPAYLRCRRHLQRITQRARGAADRPALRLPRYQFLRLDSDSR